MIRMHWRVFEDQTSFVMLQCIVCCWRHTALCSVTVLLRLETQTKVSGCLAFSANSPRGLRARVRRLILRPAAREAPRSSEHICLYMSAKPASNMLQISASEHRESGSRWRHFSLYNAWWWLKLNPEISTEKLFRIESCVFGEGLRNEESGEGLFFSLWRAQWEAGAWTPADGCHQTTHLKQASSQVVCSPGQWRF